MKKFLDDDLTELMWEQNLPEEDTVNHERWKPHVREPLKENKKLSKERSTRFVTQIN